MAKLIHPKSLIYPIYEYICVQSLLEAVSRNINLSAVKKLMLLCFNRHLKRENTLIEIGKGKS